MRALVVAGSLLAFADLGPNCGSKSEECTLIGCTDGFHVTISPKTPTFGVTTLGIDIDPGTGNVHFDCTFPLNAMDSSCAGPTSPTLSVQNTGNTSVEIELSDLPGHVTVTVTRGGATVGTGAFTPGYHANYPNGTNCAPVCQQAQETIRID